MKILSNWCAGSICLLLASVAQAGSNGEALFEAAEQAWRLTQKGLPHAARAAWEACDKTCLTLRPDAFAAVEPRSRGKVAGHCAWVAAELLAEEPSPWHFSKARRLKQDWLTFQTSDVAEKERLLLTGRLRAALSPPYGQDFLASLLALRTLERLAPERPEVKKEIAVSLYRQGNSAAARRELGGDFDWLPNLDFDYGVRPYFFNSPARGIGVGVVAWDDRLSDGPVSVFTQASLSSRLNLRANLVARYAGWSAAVGGADEIQDSALGSFRTTRLGGQVSYNYPVGNFGIEVEGQAEVFGPRGLPPGYVTSHFIGGTLKPYWDTRDRVEFPRSGSYVSFGTGLFSAASSPFLKLQLEGAAHRSLSVRQTISFAVNAYSVSHSAPFNAWGDLSKEGGVLGVQLFRFRERAMAGASVRYRHRVLGWLHSGAYVSTAVVGDNFERAMQTLRLGAGMEATLQFTRSPRWLPRWELGWFDGAWVFQGGMSAFF